MTRCAPPTGCPCHWLSLKSACAISIDAKLNLYLFLRKLSIGDECRRRRTRKYQNNCAQVLTILNNILKLHFAHWHLSRIKCLSYLIMGLFQVKTVNLTEIATTFPGRAEIDSNYRRLQRFFQQIEFNSAVIVQLVVAFLPYTTYTLA